MSDYIKVPKIELEKLEDSRRKLYDFCDKYFDKKRFDVNSNEHIIELLNITKQIWKVANTKNWYHFDATDPLIETSNNTVREIEVKFKVNIFDDIEIKNSDIFELIVGNVPSFVYRDDPNDYYEIVEITLE